MKSLDELLKGKKIVICVGSGGVGKTTVSASIALHCAMTGRRTLALTIDPAKRLANSLGLKSLGNTETLIPRERFEAVGLEPKGTLSAMMLDTKRAFDDMIQKLAPSREAARAILANTFYQNLSTAMAGSHEYVAMEKLYDLYSQGRHDLIVLDTPPTKQAIDFLDAPQRMSAFLDKDVLKWFLMPYFKAGKIGLKALNQTGALVFKTLEWITGIEFLRDVSDFFIGFNNIFEEFRKETGKVSELLRSDQALFLLVLTPSHMPLEEARFFYDKLSASQMPFGGFIFNRVHPDLLAATPVAPDGASDNGSRAIEEDGASAFGDFAGTMVDNFRNIQTLAEIDEERTARFVESLGGEFPFWKIPFQDEDVFDLTGLKEVAHFLCGDPGKDASPRPVESPPPQARTANP